MKKNDNKVVFEACRNELYALVPTVIWYKETERFEGCKPWIISFIWLNLSFLICIRA